MSGAHPGSLFRAEPSSSDSEPDFPVDNIIEIPIDYPGPTTQIEMHQWPEKQMERMHTTAPEDLEKAAEFLKSVDHIIVTSKWCGVAGMHIGFNYWMDVVRKSLGISVPITTYSFTESEPVCQQLLVTFGPHHLMVDVKALMYEDLMTRIATRQAELRQEYMEFNTDRTALRRARQAAEEKKQLKHRLTETFKEYVLEEVKGTTPPSRAFCALCGGMCKQFPTVKGNTLWFEFASPSCQPWSSQGTGFGWLGEPMLAVIAWAASLRTHTPDWIMLEETPRFDISFLQELSGNALQEWTSMTAAPAHVGIPLAGRRLWLDALGPRVQFRNKPWTDKVLKSQIMKRVDGRCEFFLTDDEAAVEEFLNWVNTQQAKRLPHPRGSHVFCFCFTTSTT